MAEKEINNTESEAERQMNGQETKHELVFNKCCLFVPLRTGCLILAYMYLVVCIANLILASVLIFKFVNLLPRNYSAGIERVFVPHITFHVVTFIIFLLLISIIVLLLIGLHKNNSKFVKIYVSTQLAVLILNIIRLCVSINVLHSYWLSFIIDLVNLAIGVYCLLVMTSQYVHLARASSTCFHNCTEMASLTTLITQAEP